MKEYLTIMAFILFSITSNAESSINNMIYPLTGGQCSLQNPTVNISLNSLPTNAYYEVTCTITKPQTYSGLVEMMSSGMQGTKPMSYTLNDKHSSMVFNLKQPQNIYVAKGIFISSIISYSYGLSMVSDTKTIVMVSNCYANQIQYVSQ